MFKIDWPCAIGGAVLGYYAKGKVDSTKAVVKKISTDAIASLKESFYDFEEPKAHAGQTGQNGNGGTV